MASQNRSAQSQSDVFLHRQKVIMCHDEIKLQSFLSKPSCDRGIDRAPMRKKNKGDLCNLSEGGRLSREERIVLRRDKFQTILEQLVIHDRFRKRVDIPDAEIRFPRPNSFIDPLVNASLDIKIHARMAVSILKDVSRQVKIHDHV